MFLPPIHHPETLFADLKNTKPNQTKTSFTFHLAKVKKSWILWVFLIRLMNYLSEVGAGDFKF